jgi:hypothetical protein
MLFVKQQVVGALSHQADNILTNYWKAGLLYIRIQPVSASTASISLTYICKVHG